jgi:hypothetical protein
VQAQFRNNLWPFCAESLHSQYFLQRQMGLRVMWNRHCPSIDSARGLTVALDSGRPVIVLLLAAEPSPTGEREDRLHLSQSRLLRCNLEGSKRTLELEAKSRRDKLFEDYLEE